MVSPSQPVRPQVADFQLGEWLVQPSLNRLTHGHRVVQIEPKLMDVLVFLASRAGEVVSKRDLTDAVWPELFITESVISRAIAGLRRALHDDARNPSFIETILKRGYRLIAEVSVPPPAAESQPVSSPPRPPDLTDAATASAAFVVGQWVRSEAFYGRRAEIAEILTGNRDWLWLLGTRRIGKTSLLKQLEHLAATSPEWGFVPVFWDLQGVGHAGELHRDFGEALLDAEERLNHAGIHLPEVASDDLFDSLARLRRKLRSRNLRLLLLCDEVEELIQLNRQDPALLRKLRREMHSREGVRSVLASSSRLWQLSDASGDTSPFLDGFTPPLYLGALTDDEARALIRQDQLLSASRPEFSEDEVEQIRDLCGNHPYLIQLLSRRVADRRDIDEAVEEIAADPTVRFFFLVDYDLFNATERAILHLLAEQPSLTTGSLGELLSEHGAALPACLDTLQRLGLVRKGQEGELAVASALFRRWLESHSEQ